MHLAKVGIRKYKPMKKIFFTILSTFLAYMSVKLIVQIKGLPDQNFDWWISFIFAILLCLYVTGVFAFVGFQFPTHKLLPQSYYRIKNPKLVLAIHKYMGVKYFNIFLMAVIWGKPKNRKKFFDGTRAGLDNLIYQTKQSEFGHIGAFAILLCLSIWIGYLGHYKMVFLISILNILGNLYPVLLQHKHRVRIDRMAKVLKKRSM